MLASVFIYLFWKKEHCSNVSLLTCFFKVNLTWWTVLLVVVIKQTISLNSSHPKALNTSPIIFDYVFCKCTFVSPFISLSVMLISSLPTLIGFSTHHPIMVCTESAPWTPLYKLFNQSTLDKWTKHRTWTYFPI